MGLVCVELHSGKVKIKSVVLASVNSMSKSNHLNYILTLTGKKTHHFGNFHVEIVAVSLSDCFKNL